MSASLGRAAIGVVAGAFAAALIAAGSAVSLPLRSGDSGRIRLSWSARPERIETCRTLADEEVAALSEHMRRQVECEGRFATYALEVTVDGQLVEQSVITGGGLRADRPMHYLRDFAVADGKREFRLSLVRRETVPVAPGDDDGGPDRGQDDDDHDDDAARPEAGRSERERSERRRREQAALPPSLGLDTTIVIQPGQVVIVTFDPVRQEFGFVTR